MKVIAAMASNRVIGKDGKLPWHIKGDLKFFKKMTDGCRCIVGRKTFESLPKLANRRFVVLTSDPDYKDKSTSLNVIESTWSSPDYLPFWDADSWVIGGAQIYHKYLPRCTDLYLTRIFKQYEGDTFFPSFHMYQQFNVVERTDEYAIVHYKNMTAS